MKKIFMTLALLGSVIVNGANIQWNCVQFHEYSTDSFGVFWHSGKYYLDVLCDFSFDSKNGEWRFSTVACGMEFVGWAYEGTKGAVVDAVSVANVESFFAYNDEGISTVPWIPIDGKSPADMYLAIALVGLDNSVVYGWVSFSVNDGIDIVNSAIDLDGGPMIVGGGSAIPEPSGGLLFLLGGAALALRRRKRTPVGAFLTSRGDGPGR